jgi:hypothetical protein
MSDLEVRRLTRELLRAGLDADGVLNAVLAELRKEHLPPMLTVDRSETFYVPAATEVRWSIRILKPGPITPVPQPGHRPCELCGTHGGIVRYQRHSDGKILCGGCAARDAVPPDGFEAPPTPR